MPKYFVRYTVEADSMAEAILCLLYPDGEPVREKITEIEIVEEGH